MFVVPTGAKHKPIARGEAHIMLIEPREVKNTGNIENELTAKNDIFHVKLRLFRPCARF